VKKIYEVAGISPAGNSTKTSRALSKRVRLYFEGANSLDKTNVSLDKPAEASVIDTKNIFKQLNQIT